MHIYNKMRHINVDTDSPRINDIRALRLLCQMITKSVKFQIYLYVCIDIEYGVRNAMQCNIINAYQKEIYCYTYKNMHTWSDIEMHIHK